MRRILIDHARSHETGKRGGDRRRMVLDENLGAGAMRPRDIVALDDALIALEKLDTRKARVVELRFFAGLTVEETAEVLGMSVETILRDWRFARTWLAREIDTNAVASRS